MACRRTLDAWDRQRGYNQWALEALGNSTEVDPTAMQTVTTCLVYASKTMPSWYVQCALETLSTGGEVRAARCAYDMRNMGMH